MAEENRMEVEEYLPKDECKIQDQTIKEESLVTQEGMKIYYEKYFPYEIFCSWLGQGDVDHFQRREFSFTLQNDVYFRFQSFSSNEELKKQIIKHCPKKIDIGAMYNVLPTQHKTANLFIPEEKEMVFDIDMDDYNDVRTCCKEASICDKCWKYMIVAYKILDTALKEDFGFKHMLYVFSGRRGIHCWICDDRARKLNDNGRAAIAHYIKYKMVNVKLDINQGLREPIHPLYERSIKIIDKYFFDVLDEQNLLNIDKGKILLKGLIKAYCFGISEIKYERLDELLNTQNKSEIKLEQIKNYIIECVQKSMKQNTKKKLDLCINDFKLNILYPRLDINVTTRINHLLKSPFCIHPKTGLVSIPLTDNDILEFKKENVPRLDALVFDFKNNNGKNECFEKFKNNFEIFVSKLVEEYKEKNKNKK